MKKKTILLLGLGSILVLGIVVLNPFKQKNLLSPSNTNQQQSAQITPSKTLKSYTDPSGFSFNYPDNLSLLNNELKDANSYAELQLAAKGLVGSLILKITDNKLTSLDEWVKVNKNGPDTAKETKLGNLKAMEITKKDKLLLGALDQGILFTMEIPQGAEKDFWGEVLNIVSADFSFAPPAQASEVGTSDDVTFDGEEVVE